MRRFNPLFLALIPFAAQAGNCADEPPPYTPVAQSFEATCSAGQTVVDLRKAKSPVIRLRFSRDQELSVTTVSGATSAGGNGRGAQVCIWTSWESSGPCGASQVSADGFNAWDGRASCGVRAPKGEVYVRALQVNSNADEQNTTLTIACR